MQCKIEHTDGDAMPEFLCRACHPELNTTPEQRKAAVAAERAQREQYALRQDLLRTQTRLERCEAAMARSSNRGIEARKAAALRRKIQRLEKELEGQVLMGIVLIIASCISLAFMGFGDKDKPGGLFVMPSTGGSPKLLVEAKDRRGVVTWSPDGSQLYYAVPFEVSGDGTPATLRTELWSVPSQGGEPQRLGLTVDGMVFSLRIHPDGQRIAYVARMRQAKAANDGAAS